MLMLVPIATYFPGLGKRLAFATVGVGVAAAGALSCDASEHAAAATAAHNANR
jgi:hypothetical protein